MTKLASKVSLSTSFVYVAKVTLNLVCICLSTTEMSTPPILPRRPPILKPIHLTNTHQTKRTPAKPPVLQPMNRRPTVISSTTPSTTPSSSYTTTTFKAKFKVEIEHKMRGRQFQPAVDDDLISVTCTPECPEDEEDPITSFSDEEQPIRSFKPPKKKLKLVVVQSL